MKSKQFEIKLLIGLIIVGMFAVLGYLALYGNAAEVYTDIIVEWGAYWESNKSAERNMVYYIIFAGSACYALIYFFLLRCKKTQVISEKIDTLTDNTKVWIVVLSTMCLTTYFIYQQTIPLLLWVVVVVILNAYQDHTKILNSVCNFFFCYYAVHAIIRVYVLLGGSKTISDTLVGFIALLLCCVILRAKSNYTQLLLPLLLLLFLQNKYVTEDGIVEIEVISIVKWLVIVLVILFELEIVWNVRKKEIGLGSCASILIYNSFLGTGAIMPSDMHHDFENIIGYSQIVELGQTPFEDYIPVSGMYSVVHGFFFKFFGNGLFANYYISTNVFYAFIGILIIFLLSKQLDKSLVLLIALCLSIIEYNRVALILPSMLLLSMPQLIEKKNLWLKLWMLTSLVQGLYYPIFGVAVCVGFLPLGIYVVYSYIKSGMLKADIRKPGFWIAWGICMIPVVLSITCLLGTAKHILAMASQSVYADAIARFGQTMPDDFFPYLTNYHVTRLALYYLFTFLIPIAFVWVALALSLYVGLRLKKPMEACIGLAIAIMPTISYSYTMIRMDKNSIYARNLGPLIAGAVMLLVYCCKYVSDSTLKYITIGFAAFVPSVVMAFGFQDNEWKLSPYYTVPEGYIYTENSTVDKMGTGFIEETVYDAILAAIDRASTLNMEDSYLGVLGHFGYYYFTDVKGASTIEVGASIKGYDAAVETIELLEDNHAIVGTSISTHYNYYFYKWLLTSGKYYYDGDLFYYNDKGYSDDEVKNKNSNVNLGAENLNLAREASALGSSMESLNSLFEEIDLSIDTYVADSFISLNFEEIAGEDADFLYLEFDGVDDDFEYVLYNQGTSAIVLQDPARLYKYLLKKEYNPGKSIIINWLDDEGESHSENCLLSKGKLLIPLGSGSEWLLNNHNTISVVMQDDGEVVPVPEIKTVKFLKLREID